MRKLKIISLLLQEISFIDITWNRVKLYMPREESFPIPSKYVDVTRTTKTSLDVLLEKHIEDCWNVDGEKALSDAWTGFTRFILLNERHLTDNKVRWQTNEETNDLKTRQCMARCVERMCLMQRKREQSNNGLSRNQSSTMPDSYVVSSSLNRMIVNLRTP